MAADTFVVVGTQWGDEGKGKIIDVLAPTADYVVRYQGGNNAGHTVVVGDQKFILHLLPSGMIHCQGQCVIGSGVVVDIGVLLQEIDRLEQSGKNCDNLFIDARAHVIMPYHIALDKAKEQSLGENKIGTTNRGIGPCYADKIARNGIRVGDLLDFERFEDKLRWNLQEKNDMLAKYGTAPCDYSHVVEEFRVLAEKIKDRIIDGVSLVNDAIDADQRVLFEGAQALMLDIDYGTYPYVTSSSPSAGGVCTGAGVAPNKISRILGVMKAYTTRVGEGIFPTEQDNEIGERLRAIGNEFGATTARPRRCGWLDLVVASYASRINGLTDIVLTKIDVLTGFEKIKVAVAYHIDGVRYTSFPANLRKSQAISLEYREFDGWEEDISQVRSFDDLPKNCQNYINFIEKHLNVPVSLVSLGSEHSQNIIRGEF